jgi:hypothetical protein
MSMRAQQFSQRTASGHVCKINFPQTETDRGEVSERCEDKAWLGGVGAAAG